MLLMHWQGGHIAISVMVLGWGSWCPRFPLDLESKLKISWDIRFSSTFKSKYLFISWRPWQTFPLTKTALANMNAYWKIVNSGWLEKHGRPPIFICVWKSVHVGPHRHGTGLSSEGGLLCTCICISDPVLEQWNGRPKGTYVITVSLVSVETQMMSKS